MFLFSAIVETKQLLVKFSETGTIYILPVFIKDVVFHHAGLSWMIQIKEQYKLAVEENFIE